MVSSVEAKLSASLLLAHQSSALASCAPEDAQQSSIAITQYADTGMHCNMVIADGSLLVQNTMSRSGKSQTESSRRGTSAGDCRDGGGDAKFISIHLQKWT